MALKQYEIARRLEEVRHQVRVVSLAIVGIRGRKNLDDDMGSISTFVDSIEYQLHSLEAMFKTAETKKVASVTRLPAARLPANH